MPWRKITKEDIKVGTVIRIGYLEKIGAYNDATIIFVKKYHYNHPIKAYELRSIKVSRPYAIADINSMEESALLGQVIWDISVKKLFSDSSDYKVYEHHFGAIESLKR